MYKGNYLGALKKYALTPPTRDWGGVVRYSNYQLYRELKYLYKQVIKARRLKLKEYRFPYGRAVISLIKEDLTIPIWELIYTIEETA